MRGCFTTLTGMLLTVCLFALPVPAGADNYPEVMIILDGSGSMWAQLDGKTRIETAKQVLREIVPSLPAEVRVGLTAYGHREKGRCDDIEVLMPAGGTDRDLLLEKVMAISPKGKTPIADSVSMVVNDLRQKENETSIILVSDGLETCHSDPCALVRELKETGIKFILHVVGFAVTDVEDDQLSCLADAGGGVYYTAGNASELLAAFHSMQQELIQKVEYEKAATTQKKSRSGLGKLRVFYPDPNEKFKGLEVFTIVRKSDGAFNYAATDLATVADRIREFQPERIVYVTDERQQLHFKQIFTICAKLGCATRLDHVWFGLMRLPDATFSTRQGNVIKLERLLDEAEARALKIIEAGSPDMTPETRREVARAVGIGAVKYADLSQNPQTMIVFTWDKALALDGNSGPYLQYAYARIMSVRDKYATQFPGCDPAAWPIRLDTPVERALAVHLTRFPEAVMRAAHTYKPSTLADYLYELAQLYSSFYQNVPFLKAEEGVRESRMRLCGAVAAVLRQGLELLGLETPERI